MTDPPNPDVSPANPAAPWGWWLGPLTVAVAFITVVAVAAMTAALIGGDELQQLTGDYPQWTGIVQDLLWIGVALAVPLAAYGQLRPSHLGLTPGRLRQTAAASVCGLAAFYLLAAAYGAVAGLDQDSNERLRETGLGLSVSSDVGYVVLYVVLAPVAEELLFRGALFGSLRGRLGPWPAALISGAIFGAIHLGGGQDAFIPVLITLGVVLALAYHYSGALYAAIAIHAVNNAVSTGASRDPSEPWIYGLLIAGPGVALLLAWWLGNRIGAWAPHAARRARSDPSPSES